MWKILINGFEVFHKNSFLGFIQSDQIFKWKIKDGLLFFGPVRIIKNAKKWEIENCCSKNWS